MKRHRQSTRGWPTALIVGLLLLIASRAFADPAGWTQIPGVASSGRTATMTADSPTPVPTAAAASNVPQFPAAETRQKTQPGSHPAPSTAAGTASSAAAGAPASVAAGTTTSHTTATSASNGAGTIVSPLTGIESPGSAGISVLVLSFNPLSPEGFSGHRELSEALESFLREGAESDSARPGSAIAAIGGSWRLIDTFSLVQVAVFLPAAAESAGEIAELFLTQMNQAFSGKILKKKRPELADEVLRHLVAEQRIKPVFGQGQAVSLWLSGPLKKRETHFKTLLRNLKSPGFSLVEPFSSHPHLSSSSDTPALMRIFIWDQSSLPVLIAARFLAETAVRALGARQSWNYDVWMFPEKTVLVMAATTPVRKMYQTYREFQTMYESLDLTRLKSAWDTFYRHYLAILASEERLLEKGVLVRACRDHFEGLTAEPVTAEFTAPGHERTLTAFPHPDMNSLLTDSESNPAYVVLRFPGAGERVDVGLCITWEPSYIAEIREKLEKSGISGQGSLLLQGSASDSLYLQFDSPPEMLSQVLSEVRTMVLSTAVSVAPIEQVLAGEGRQVQQPSFALGAVGSLHTFELMGRLRDIWPSGVGKPIKRIPVDLGLLGKVLEVPGLEQLGSSEKQVTFLRGQWLTQTSTSSGMVGIITRLTGKGVPPGHFRDIEKLLGITAAPAR